MTENEFQNTTDLALVRIIKAQLEALDPSVGDVLKDEEHAAMRRQIRAWEQRLVELCKTRKQRSAPLLEALRDGGQA